ncbi:hypothetical protein COS81_01615 [candidate division WWE3 bacterium CG06_land_8_20_14_3_00_42_16]|uniref:Uncharacterized protein n=3 Tax=Katanobacteria TaxID=422282 RepID=A0A2M7ANT3_UNCKA|nr:MAG: hypothetical protein AUJ38_01050 [bacterium CG1_02_42_9]PIU69028.1 MAG: hypothetical protein COS81_01615 [candidate division WWE3 bacterium CG06_land_8_20_14_3_00_42_16]PIZ42603.1 MAG: hypothetical protein COY34_02595 [candidate division WWE3 bacterium CG_4_10_14_0_2_um_filter_42_8]PJC68990.1 MAG: hypothetical protein CO015_02005 [candidate division WWE3 bacterium CG_4_8_14_3_um_filter_42_11]
MNFKFFLDIRVFFGYTLFMYAEIIQPDLNVAFIVSRNGLQTTAEAFNQLEAKLDSLTGRKFYGTYLNGEYRACLLTQDQDESTRLELPSWTIPGGKYLKAKIKNWSRKIPSIKTTFEDMEKFASHDKSRPYIEFYRSFAELILFLPII